MMNAYMSCMKQSWLFRVGSLNLITRISGGKTIMLILVVAHGIKENNDRDIRD